MTDRAAAENDSKSPRRHKSRRLRRLLIFGLLIGALAAIVITGAIPFSVGYNSLRTTTLGGGCIEFGGTPADQGLVYRDVSIPTRWGGAYRGFFVPGTLDATILIPPTGAGGRTTTLRELGIFARHGYAVLTWEARSCIGKPITLGFREAEDVEDALAYLQRNPDHLAVSLDHIGLQGFSTGGGTVEMAAAQMPKVGAVIAEGNYAVFGDIAKSTIPHSFPEAMLGLGVRFGYWQSTGEDPANLDPLIAMPVIAPRPVLLIYGSYEDPTIAQRLIESYHTTSPNGPIHLWVVQGAGHGGYMDVAGKTTYSRIVLSFFDCALLDLNCPAAF